MPAYVAPKHANGPSLTPDPRGLRPGQALESGQQVVVDLDFEGCMTDSELHSMAHQLQHCYAANNQAAAPFHLHLTSVTVRGLHSVRIMPPDLKAGRGCCAPCQLDVWDSCLGLVHIHPVFDGDGDNRIV